MFRRGRKPYTKGIGIGFLMRRVTLQLRVRGEPRQRVWLRLGQVVEAGSSDSADICIPDDPGVQPIHIAVAHQPMGCFCECLVDSAEMRVNDQPNRRKRLKDHDTITFGDCEIEISVQQESVVREPATWEPGGTVAGTGMTSPIGPAATSPSPPGEIHRSSPIDWEPGPIPTPPQREKGQGIPEPLPPVGGRGQGEGTAGSSPIVVSEFDAQISAESPAAGGPSKQVPVVLGSEYATEKLAGHIWRYHPAPESSLDLETVVGRLAELFDIFLVVSPSTAARLATHRLLPDRMTEINVHMSLIENPDLSATMTLLRGENSRQEVMLIASRSGLSELAASLQEHAFTFGRPSIFTMQVSVAHPSLLEQVMFGKVAVLTTESGDWDLYSMVDPSEEYQFLGFDRPAVLMF